MLFTHPIHKLQGELHTLYHDFGLPYGWLLTRALADVLVPLVPDNWVAYIW